MTNETNSVLNHVSTERREFLKKLLAGAAFATPVIATFSIDALTSGTAYAAGNTTGPNTIGPGLPIGNTSNPNTTCLATDVGYTGPVYFQAHVSSGGFLPIPVGLGVFGTGYRVNGEVTFSVSGRSGAVPSVTQIQGTVTMVTGASILGGSITVGGRAATTSLPGLTSGGSFTLLSNDLASSVCDLDELADLMASGAASMTVTGKYGGINYSVSGPIMPGSPGILG